MGRRHIEDVVVLLPGITGSVLQRDGKDIWAPSAGGLLRALWTMGRSVEDLTLTDDPVDDDDLGDGVVATRLVPDLHLVPGLWGIDGYSSISAVIRAAFDVVPDKTFIELPYDWRRDNRVAARKLANRALPALHEQRKENPEAKLILIGHSMGGLVARYFLECMDGWKDTRTLITFGTPFRGSLNALDFIANGFTKKIGPLKVADLSNFLRSCTSLYQLLPIYPCISGDGQAGTASFQKVSQSAGVPHLHIGRAQKAEQDFHRAIEDAVAARSVENPYQIYPIVGITQPTRQSARLANNGLTVLNSYDGEDYEGDGTVPRVSASPLEYDGRQPDPCVYAPERHASLQNALSVQTQLLGLLTPVDRPERFRDARGGLRLELEDLYAAGEEIPLRVTAGVRRLNLVASVVNMETLRPTVGPLPLLAGDNPLQHAVELPPLSNGSYRVTISAFGEHSGQVQPVHGVFLVTDEEDLH